MAPAAAPKLPVVQSKKRHVEVVATLKEFGKEWQLVRPNALLANAVIQGDSIDASKLNAYFRDHVHPDEREDFLTAAMGDPTMDVIALMDLMGRMSEAVFSGMEAADDGVIEASSKPK